MYHPGQLSNKPLQPTSGADSFGLVAAAVIAAQITYYRPYLVAGKTEITRLGEPLPENTGIALTAEVPKRVFPGAQEIKLTEADIEHIGFTLLHVIGPTFTNTAIPAVAPATGSHGGSLSGVPRTR